MPLQKCELNLDRTKRELRPHGSLDFPCAGYSKKYRNRAGDEISWHWHEEIEILYCAGGTIKVQVPGKTYCMKEGELLFINAGVLHYGAAEEYCYLQSLVFHPLLLTGTEDSVFARKYIGPLTQCAVLDSCLFNNDNLQHEVAVESFLKAFLALSSDIPGYEFVVRENLSNICCDLYQHHREKIKEPHVAVNQDTERIRKMMDYMHSHYSEKVELSQVAGQAGIGERECLRCFQRILQISPMQYLLKYRILQGASMLLTGEDSIAEIAIQAGFDSPSNFTQMFKRFYKYTPTEYRKRYSSKKHIMQREIHG